MTTKMLEHEMVEPDGYLQPKKYRVRYECEKCGHTYSKVFKAIPVNDPPCPNKACAEKSEIADLKLQLARMEKMLLEQKAPAQNGTKLVVKAVDETAKIVMEDYNMTNLRDGIRHGEDMAPKLPPAQQAAADGYFGGKGLQSRGISSKQADLIRKRAISGAYRGMAVAPTAVMPGATTGQSPLRLIGREPTGKR